MNTRQSKLLQRTTELISDWDDELFDDPRDAGQEAQELLAAGAPQKAELERVLREVLAVLKGKPLVAPRPSKRAPKPAPTKGPAFVAALLEGQALARHLAPTRDDFLVSQVTTVVRALVIDDSGAWAKRQLKTWPRDVPFTKHQLSRWKPQVLRPRVIENAPAFADLVRQLPGPAFQLREDLITVLGDLVVREAATRQLTTPAMKRALLKWTDGAALLRLTLHFRQRASTATGFEALAAFFETTVPARFKKTLAEADD